MQLLITLAAFVGPLQGGIIPKGTRQEVFHQIFFWFLVIGTLVSVVVIGYMLYNAYKYRDSRDREPAEDIDRPELGELPEGGGGGRKLFFSLTLSAVIVISLIAGTYFSLLYVERGAASPGEAGLEVKVIGYQFGWEFVYPNGYTTTNTLRVPRGERVMLTVTSRDVIHNFGIPAFRIKTDAMPGLTTDTWFNATETGTYQAQCFELCGAGHSLMEAKVIVMEPAAFERWYENTTPTNSAATTNATATTTTATTNTTTST